jgi:DNA repair protein RadC
LAPSRGSISHPTHLDASRNTVGRGARLPFDWRDPRPLELSAAVHSRMGNTAQPGAGSADDVNLLCELIASAAGAAAPSLSMALIDRHGSLQNLLKSFEQEAAPDIDLPESVHRVLALVARTIVNVLEFRALSGPVFSTTESVIDYLAHDLLHLPRETFKVLFLDATNRLIALEAMGTGSVSSVYVYPREIVRRALELNATALIAVHNHPSGDPTPSRLDIDVTRRIEAACRLVELVLHDHVIIAASGWCSLRTAGLMNVPPAIRRPEKSGRSGP